MHHFYEFFAGGGMARLGLGDAWTCAFANDIDKKKAASYRANFSDSHLRVDDIRNLTLHDLPDSPTLAWASFPCQDLSLAGRGDGLVGERSGTFWPFWKLMQGMHGQKRPPKMIVLENVCGAITSNNGKDFAAIAKAISSLGYRFGAVVVDAIHFVPQSRPRLFIIAVDPKMKLPNGATRADPSGLWHPRSLVDAKFALPKRAQDNWIWWDMPAPPQRTTVLADLFEDEPTSVAWDSRKATDALLQIMSPLNSEKVRDARRAGNLRVGALYKRTRGGQQRAEVRFDDVAGCLRTPGGGSSRQTILVVNSKSVRSRLLSTREAGRLMGLPESYILPDNYNDAYRLAGDGLVVPAVTHLTTHLLTPTACLNLKRVVVAA